MGNPLLLLSSRKRRTPATVRLAGGLRRVRVPIPRQLPPTDAVFVVLRRLRLPLVLLVVIMAVSVTGLALIPGQDDQGNSVNLTVFDAFYIMSYTATTIGFGETPYAFTVAQRLWVTASIYASVLGWAVVLATLMRTFVQDDGLRQVMAVQSFARRVKRLREPFVIIAGYGKAGRFVAQGLDEAGRRVVIIDGNQDSIAQLEQDVLHHEAIGLSADIRLPEVLGLAGLAHPKCQGVLALTDDDQTNLAVVMAVQLLHPCLPVIARCSDPKVQQQMHNFSAKFVVNPYDRFGAYLALALQQPVTFQLISWLMSPAGTLMPQQRPALDQGQWVVCADGRFGREVTADLCRSGLQVQVLEPSGKFPDLDDSQMEQVATAVGFLAGTDNDLANIALAAKARLARQDLFICVRQRTHSYITLLEAFDPDAVFVPTQLVSREVLAQAITPRFWSFINHAMQQDQQWAQQVLQAVQQACGQKSPTPNALQLDLKTAPAIVRWLREGKQFCVGDLLRDPDQREQRVGAVVLVLVRDGQHHYLPDLAEPLAEGDELVLLTTPRGADLVESVLYYDSAVSYVAADQRVSATWWLRQLRATRHGSNAAKPAIKSKN